MTPKLSGKNWLVPCVAHGGDGFNLSLTDTESNGLLAFCFSQNCSYKSIIEAIEKHIPDFRQRWDYGDGRYQSRGTMSRKEGKFSNSPGEAKGAPVLLRGDEPGQHIALVEGERTADAILSLHKGYGVATVFKSKFAIADYSALAGRSVIVWTDNDKVGRKNAADAVQQLHDVGAANILMVTVRDGWPAKADAADLPPNDVLAALEAAQPVAVVKVSAESGEPVHTPTPLEPRTWSAIGANPPTRQWLVREWLPANCVTVFSGHGGHGKSRLALQLAAGIASRAAQGEWIRGTGGTRTGPEVETTGPVMYASWEDDGLEFTRRLSAFSTEPWISLADMEDLYFVDMAGRGALWGPEKGKHTSTAADILDAGRELQKLAEALEPILLVIDPLAAAYLGNENDRALVRAFMSHWDVWARRKKRSVLMIAHKPKYADGGDGRPSSSSDWEASARAVWSLDYLKQGKLPGKGKDDEREAYPRLAVTKSNYGQLPDALQLKMGSGPRWEVAGPWEVLDETY